MTYTLLIENTGEVKFLYDLLIPTPFIAFSLIGYLKFIILSKNIPQCFCRIGTNHWCFMKTHFWMKSFL